MKLSTGRLGAIFLVALLVMVLLASIDAKKKGHKKGKKNGHGDGKAFEPSPVCTSDMVKVDCGGDDDPEPFFFNNTGKTCVTSASECFGGFNSYESLDQCRSFCNPNATLVVLPDPATRL